MTSCGNSTNTETTASGNSESTESSAIDSNITDNDESTNVEITSDVLSDSETEKDSSETSSEITIDSDTTADTVTESGATTDTVTESGTTTDTETELGSSEDVTTTETESDTKTEEETEDPRLSEEYAPVLYFSGKDIYNIASEYIDGWKTGAGYLDDCQLLDNGKTARLITNTANIEAFLPLLTSPAEAAPYIAIKYRTNTPNILLQVFADSEYLSVQGGSVCDFSVSSSGRWETTVIDLTSKIAKFDGEIVNYIRFDFLNSPSKNLKEGDYMDIEYIGFFKSEADFAKFEGIKTKYDYSLNDPTSGYELYNLVYGAHIDSASATLDGNAVKNMNPGVSANSKDNRFLISVNANADTIDMKGWAVVDGGIAGYKWSADGGKTWHDAYLVGGGTFNNLGVEHLKAVALYVKNDMSQYENIFTSLDSSKAGGGFQHAALRIDLGAYEGQTVDVVFAAVSAKDQTKLCPLAIFTGITVGAESNTNDETKVIIDESKN